MIAQKIKIKTPPTMLAAIKTTGFISLTQACLHDRLQFPFEPVPACFPVKSSLIDALLQSEDLRFSVF
jgi:hypothetical protein